MLSSLLYPVSEQEYTLARLYWETVLEFFQLFFSVEMITKKCYHTISYANDHYLRNSPILHQTCLGNMGGNNTRQNEETDCSCDIFWSLRISSHIDKYWSTKTLYHGLWARTIIPCIRFRSLMAFLHVADPCTEAPGNTVESFLETSTSSVKNCTKQIKTLQ